MHGSQAPQCVCERDFPSVPMGTYVTSVSDQVEDVITPRHLVSLVLLILCDLMPPTAGNSAFKERSGVNTSVLQFNLSTLFDDFGK